MVDAVVERFGRLDILVNNAGVHSGAKAWEMTEAQWDAVVDVDLKAPWLCTKHVSAAHGRARRTGRIITISSTSGLVGLPSRSATSRPSTGSSGRCGRSRWSGAVRT